MGSKLIILILLTCFGATKAFAGTSEAATPPSAQASPAPASEGTEVVVVYNRKLPDSRRVAEDYAGKRQVPPDRVWGLELSTNEVISRAEFRETLQTPLANKLEQQKLWSLGDVVVSLNTSGAETKVRKVVRSDIRYAVLCFGVPLKIAADPSLIDTNSPLRPELRRNEASVDTELALLPVLPQKPPLDGPLRNPVFAVTNGTGIHPTNGVLMVARLDGPSFEVATGLVAKALEAERDGLWGRGYFDIRNIADTNYQSGDRWIKGAAEIARRLGFETVVDEKSTTFPIDFPMSHIAVYMGWYDTDVSGPLSLPQVEFVPGAFAYHLHSLSANTTRDPSHNWVGPLLARGVTATMGCVYEPYLGGTPDVAVFAGRWLYQGFSFGEAAYASQPVLSWQTTFVGDPLYRPVRKNPDQLCQELARRQSRLTDWCYLRLVNANVANGHSAAAATALMEGLPLTKGSAVLTEKLADLYGILGKPESALATYARALKLKPSPQQEIRLMLALGGRQETAKRLSEAYDTYESLLRGHPDYPGRLTIRKKLAQMAKDLGRPADAETHLAVILKLESPTAATNAAPTVTNTPASAGN